MARQKYGEYTLDLRGLGTIQPDETTKIDLSSYINEDNYNVIFGYQNKTINVILPTMNITNTDATINISGYGGFKCKFVYNGGDYIAFKDYVWDENDNFCSLDIVISGSALYLSIIPEIIVAGE